MTGYDHGDDYPAELAEAETAGAGEPRWYQDESGEAALIEHYRWLAEEEDMRARIAREFGLTPELA